MIKMQPSIADNPLINPAGPYGLPDFARIKPGHFQPALELAGGRLLAAVAAIKDNPVPPDFKNTVEALEFAYEDIERVSNTFRAMKVFAPDCKDFHAVKTSFHDRQSDIYHEVTHDSALFDRIEAVYQKREQAALTADERKLLDATYERFIDRGVKLSPADQANKKLHDRELRKLTASFARNVANNDWKGNDVVVPAVLYERQEVARIMGEKSYADSCADASLPGSTGKIVELLQDLKAEYEEIGKNAAAWPTPAVKIADLHFKLEDVQERMNFVLEKYLGVVMVPHEGAIPSPHPEMLAHEVRHAATGERIGLAFVDLYDRPEQCDYCCADILQARTRRDGVEKLPVGTLNYTFEKDEQGHAKPLSYRRVQLYFHEMGHLMQVMRTNSPYAELSGWPATAASELFSLVLENLASEPEILSGLARNATGEIVPDETLAQALLFDKYADKTSASTSYSRALYDINFALMDVEAHAMPLERPLPSGSELHKSLADKTGLTEEFVRLECRGSRHSFGDLGYGGTYSSYPVADCAIKTLFRENSENGGLLNKPGSLDKLGTLFQTSVAGKNIGATFRAIAGTAPDPKAVLPRNNVSNGLHLLKAA